MNQHIIPSTASGPAVEKRKKGQLTLEAILVWDGNLAELLDDDALSKIGSAVVQEGRFDDANRKDWLAQAKRSTEAARQKGKPKKTYPFEKAANVQFPLLTSAALQFHARAYGAIVRGDEVISCKVNGKDTAGKKAARAQRVAAFMNDQLTYQCTEWEPGTDVLLLQLPITGMAFRKVYWDVNLNRPRLDFANAIDVILPKDVQSLDLTPRLTHILRKFPYEISALINSEQWLKFEYTKRTEDSQAPEIFYEQCRYEDLDGDGVDEPYIVTVHLDSCKVVRIDPAFDDRDIVYKKDRKTGQDRVVQINRILPWVDYPFLPDPEGSIYGMGFGALLEQISETVDTLINQMIDAAHWANTNTGFLSSGVKTRGGDIIMEPNKYYFLDGVTDIREAVMPVQFPGPSSVTFQLLEFLLGAAKDITSVKDVLTGEAPGQQPATSTLALIEQGMQVFSSIYKRVYRSQTREAELLARLNARYLEDEVYQNFVDELPDPDEEEAANSMMGHNGGPALEDPAAMPPEGAPMPPPEAPMPGAPAPAPMPDPAMAGVAPMPPADGAIPPQMLPQAPPAPPMGGPEMPPPAPPEAPAPPMSPAKPPVSVEDDFNVDDMDIRPVADPNAVTETQRMAKAQVKLQFYQDPRVDGAAIIRSVFEDARIPDGDQFVPKTNPALDAQNQAAMRQQAAQSADLESKAAQQAASAQKTQADAQSAAVKDDIALADLALRERALDLQERELELREQELQADRDFREWEMILKEFGIELDNARTDADFSSKREGSNREERRAQREDQFKRRDQAHRERMDMRNADREDRRSKEKPAKRK